MPLTLRAHNFRGNFRGAPRWLADFRERSLSIVPWPALLDPAQFNDYSSVVVTVGVAGAAIGATTVPIAALTQGVDVTNVALSAGLIVIPTGTVLSFGGGKFARLTADAVLGATSLTVAALPTALVSGDVARYQEFGGANFKYLPSGILAGRTIAERDAGTAFGPADVVTPDDEIFLTAYDIPDLITNSECEFVKHGATIKENYLPDWATLTTAQKTWLRANYNCITGVD